jgi:hypothetical protein
MNIGRTLTLISITIMIYTLCATGCSAPKCKYRPSPIDSVVSVGPTHATFTRHLAAPSLRIGIDPANSVTVSESGDIHLPPTGDIILNLTDGTVIRIRNNKVFQTQEK